LAWLYYITTKNLVDEYNVIGTVLILLTWPIHLVYKLIKK